MPLKTALHRSEAAMHPTLIDVLRTSILEFESVLKQHNELMTRGNMTALIAQFFAFALSLAMLACSTVSSSAPTPEGKAIVPADPISEAKGTQTAVFAGGCF